MNRKDAVLLFLLFVIVALMSCQAGMSSVGSRLLIPTDSNAQCIMLDGNVERITWDSDGTLIWEAPLGDRVFFSFPLPEGESFADYGLGKFDLFVHNQVIALPFKNRMIEDLDLNVEISVGASIGTGLPPSLQPQLFSGCDSGRNCYRDIVLLPPGLVGDDLVCGGSGLFERNRQLIDKVLAFSDLWSAAETAGK